MVFRQQGWCAGSMGGVFRAAGVVCSGSRGGVQAAWVVCRQQGWCAGSRGGVQGRKGGVQAAEVGLGVRLEGSMATGLGPGPGLGRVTDYGLRYG